MLLLTLLACAPIPDIDEDGFPDTMDRDDELSAPRSGTAPAPPATAPPP